MIVGTRRALVTTAAPSGVRSSESKITRRGGTRGSGTSRTVSRGSSASTVRPGPDVDRDSRTAKTLGTASRFRIRIGGRNDDAPYSRRDQGVRARRRLAVMRTGLEGNVERRAASAVPGGPQRRDFGVLL